MGYTTLIAEKKDLVATITLNRPAAMNAFDWTLNDEFVTALDELDHDDEVNVVVVTGSGRAFSAGRDLHEVGRPRNSGPDRPPAFSAPAYCSKPVIAAVNGYAITGGLELALNCDIIIAAENAKFADTHARLGLMPGAGLSQVLPRLVGTKKAKEMSFSGNFVSAQEAWHFGMVNKVVAMDDLMPTARQMATEIASCDQTIVRKMKRLIDSGDGQPLQTALMMESLENMRHRQTLSADTVEGRRKGVLERGRAQAGG